MADNHVWVSAYFPHPFRLNQVVHASWRAERQGGAGASPPPGFLPATVDLDQLTTTAASRTFVCLRPHLSDCHLGSSRLQPRTPAAHSVVFVRLNARFGSALTTPSRACTVTTGSTAGTAGCLARMASVPPWSLTCTISVKIITVLTRYRPIVLELI